MSMISPNMSRQTVRQLSPPSDGKVFLLSDVHASFQALCKVLGRIPDGSTIVNTGDAVGYGGRPNQCLDEMFRRQVHCTMGNHDNSMGVPPLPGTYHKDVMQSFDWTRKTLSRQNLDRIASFPDSLEMPLPDRSILSFCHGSPDDPLDAYLRPYNMLPDARAAIRRAFQYMAKGEIYFVGHTHLPMLWGQSRGLTIPLYSYYGDHAEVSYQLAKGERYIINPGSVGQPRDPIDGILGLHDYAKYAMFDTVKWSITFFAVPYNISAAQDAIVEAGLPKFHADRLFRDSDY